MHSMTVASVQVKALGTATRRTGDVRLRAYGTATMKHEGPYPSLGWRRDTGPCSLGSKHSVGRIRIKQAPSLAARKRRL